MFIIFNNDIVVLPHNEINRHLHRDMFGLVHVPVKEQLWLKVEKTLFPTGSLKA